MISIYNQIDDIIGSKVSFSQMQHITIHEVNNKVYHKVRYKIYEKIANNIQNRVTDRIHNEIYNETRWLEWYY